MHNDDERDFVEEAYWSMFCPACGESPCSGGAGKGSCDNGEDN